LKKVNKLLLIFILVVNGYIILSPFWPEAEYMIETKITKPVSVSSDYENVDRSINHLVIPKLQLDEKILEGERAGILDDGIWRRPHTSTPDNGSNTVIVGHRFTYHSKPPFYHLDKLAENDKILVVYDGKIYEYKIFEERITHANDKTVEAQSQENILTLYTCDPLWTAENRLIYTSSLERVIE
jgi:sortase A